MYESYMLYWAYLEKGREMEITIMVYIGIGSWVPFGAPVVRLGGGFRV